MYHVLKKKKTKQPQLPLSMELKNSPESINSPCFHFADEELKPQRKEESHLRPFLLTSPSSPASFLPWS